MVQEHRRNPRLAACASQVLQQKVFGIALICQRQTFVALQFVASSFAHHDYGSGLPQVTLRREHQSSGVTECSTETLRDGYWLAVSWLWGWILSVSEHVEQNTWNRTLERLRCFDPIWAENPRGKRVWQERSGLGKQTPVPCFPRRISSFLSIK